MVFFVGDAPSKKNLNPDIPFVGTNSYVTLLSWIAKLDIDVTDVVLANKDQVTVDRYGHRIAETVSTYSNILEGDSVIALGDSASQYLKALEIPHFKLPHPSGRNRKLNDREYVNKILGECKKYLQINESIEL